jgi:hypothetical protein
MRVAILAVALVLAVGAFALGRATAGNGGDGAEPGLGNGDLTVDVGDELEVPSVALFCKSYVELGTSKLLCNRTGKAARWQVIFERERTEIGRIGDPGDQRIFAER